MPIQRGLFYRVEDCSRCNRISSVKYLTEEKARTAEIRHERKCKVGKTSTKFQSKVCRGCARLLPPDAFSYRCGSPKESGLRKARCKECVALEWHYKWKHRQKKK